MKAILLTLILALSCTRTAEVSRDSLNANISPVSMEISHLDQIEWPVGKRNEEKVGQSFTFIVDMPRLSESDMDYLTERYGIDGWILRLIVRRGSETQDLGSLYSLFRPKKSSRSSFNSGSATSVSLKIFYAAAYASERFRKLKCPAFGHSRKISSMSIEGKNEDFAITVGNAIHYGEKSQRVELTPSSFNAGHSLVGEYFIEIAPYNSKTKTIHGGFKRIPMFINIAQEKIIRIKSCDEISSEQH